MREHVHCPCGTKGKVRIIGGVITVFYKRPDGTWWTDKVSERDLEEGMLCGFCGVPSQTLRWNGLAQMKRKR